MINIALYLVTTLFVLKVLWNLTLPYVLAWRRYRGPGRANSGISLIPYLEIVLLIIATCVAALSHGPGWLHRPGRVAIWGGAVILLSYVHLAVAGVAAGWLVSALQRTRGTTTRT